jgi:hypothetical protein
MYWLYGFLLQCRETKFSSQKTAIGFTIVTMLASIKQPNIINWPLNVVMPGPSTDWGDCSIKAWE